MYYSTPVYQFRMKCHLCDNHFEIKTDPGVIETNNLILIIQSFKIYFDFSKLLTEFRLCDYKWCSEARKSMGSHRK